MKKFTMFSNKYVLYLGIMSSILFITPAYPTPLADNIIAMINQHETMSDKAIIELAQRIIEVSVPESVHPYDGLTIEQAEAAAEIFAKKDKKFIDHSYITPLELAIDILMDYAHPENYYR